MDPQGGDHRVLGKSLSNSGETGSGAVVTGVPLGSSHGPVSVSENIKSIVSIQTLAFQCNYNFERQLLLYQYNYSKFAMIGAVELHSGHCL